MNPTLLTFSPSRTEGNVLEHPFTLGGVPGLLWTPVAAPDTATVPLVLAGQPGGFSLERLRPRLLGRAQASAAAGMATAALEMPGAGDRDPLPGVDAARRELRDAVLSGVPVEPDVIDRLVLPLVAVAVPEWRALLDAVGVGTPGGVAHAGPAGGNEAPALPRFGERVGLSGGLASIGVALAAAEPRIAAAVIFAGSYLPRSIIEAAREVTIPIHLLLQWDDEGNDRAASLELFDALGSAEKNLNANLGGHTGVPAHAGEAAGRFLARHLA